MRWQELQPVIEQMPLFESSVFLTGERTPHQVQRQLSDWVRADKLHQLRRGLYAVPDSKLHPFVVANRLVTGSYVSLEMALAYYHLIPEHVAVVTSVTTKRPGKWENDFGRFHYRHITPTFFYGIDYRQLVDDTYAFVATPEKALLDSVYLRKRGDSPAYIESLRLQNLETLNLDRLHLFARLSGKPKLKRAAKLIEAAAVQEAEEYETL